MRINIYIVLLLLLITYGSGLGQQKPAQSLYMFDQSLLNPAYVGSHVQLSGTLINRNQWVNLPGAPVTQTFSVHSSFFDAKVGVGLVMTRDIIGIHEDYGLYGNYAFHLPMANDAKLSMGLQAGFNHLTSDFNMLNIRDQTDPNLRGALSKLNPNFGAGLYYYAEDFYAGFSVPYLLENKIVDVEGVLSEARQSRNYYIHGGVTLRPSNVFAIKPAALVRMQEGAPFGFDLNTTFIYDETVGLGVSYRSNDALIGLFELRLLPELHLGYAYDYTTSDLNKFSNGSHEIMVNYRVKVTRGHKSKPCPAYF